MNAPDSQTLQARELGAQVIDACLAMGFAVAGIAPAVPTAFRDEYLAWIAAGKHGDMDYLAAQVEERLDVRRLLDGARSVIVVADQYAPRSSDAPAPQTGEPSGQIAKYARGRDYHAVIRRRLHALCDRLRATHPGAAFRAFVDTAPALEREHAARAGLGFIGRHTLLIHPRMGSYLLLGGVATTLELTAPHPPSGIPHAASESHCGSCTACIDACPTHAITPYHVDATRCVSYLTLEHRGLIDPALHAGIGERLIGCDVCQDVCPFNRAHEPASQERDRQHPAYADPEGLRASLPILRVLNWSEEDRSRVLSQSAAKRASLTMIRRNALVAAGNTLARHSEPALRERVEAISNDAREDPIVRATATQVLDRTQIKA